MIFASSGAFICTGSGALANDLGAGRQAEVERTYEIERTVEVETDQSLGQQQRAQFGQQQGARMDAQIIDEPAGAERQTMHAGQAQFGTFHRSSDLIGMEVRNQQNERLGTVRDAMVDLQTGRVAFVVLSGAGAGDRLVAIPPQALNIQGQDRIVLNMDRERLRAAPSFERNRWPERIDQQWSSDVYRFYGAQPYWQMGAVQGYPGQRAEIYTETTIEEPAGAQFQQHHGAGQWQHGARLVGPGGSDLYERRIEQADGITRLDDISGNRVRGGAVDLQPFAQRNEGLRQDSSMIPHQAAGARGMYQQREFQQRETYQQPGTTYRGAQQYQERYPTAGMREQGRLHRASELVGMNVRNQQGEQIGEIRDVVLDLNTGHVAYAVINADRFLDTRNELVAVPPSLFTTTDARTVSLNATRNNLMNAPRFQRENWAQVSNQQFVSRVYSHYGQQPYWQTGQFQHGTQFRDPAGAGFEQQDQYQLQYQEGLQQDQFRQDQLRQDEFQQDQTFQQQQVGEPAGAAVEVQQYEEQQRFQQERIEQDQYRQDQLREGQLQRDQQFQQDQTLPQQQIDEPAGAATDVGVDAQIQQDPAVGQPQIDDPAGAQTQDLQLQREQPERVISEPAGAELQQQQHQQLEAEPRAQTEADQAGAPGAGFQAEAQIDEAAGAELHQTERREHVFQSSPELQEPAGAQPADQQVTPGVQAEAELQQHAGEEYRAQRPALQDPAGAELRADAELERPQVDEAAGAARDRDLIEQVRSNLEQDPALRGQDI
ncbi:MAG: PRC-barrel domain-containing protein, partial [Limisphaerales bacterium]